MDGQTVKRVVIAGGGTAGWIAAAALAHHLGPLIDITLVESDDIGTIGVGESTIPTTHTFHNFLGIDEREFMRATKSTFKLGISFENWAREGDRYIHSFGTVGPGTWMADFHHFWLEARRQGFAGDIGDYCFELQAALAKKFATSDSGQINYAYHLDATPYGKYLRARAEAAGAKRVEGKIREVRQNSASGNIEALELESGAIIEGDLFIDCTGFRGLLIEQKLKAGFDDWSKWLPTDSALALQTEAIGPALPYTRAIAHSAGWQWRIPLQHRIGNGFVYSSAHLSDDDARTQLLGRIDGDPITEPRLIRFKAGTRRKSWVNNCIALGLSSGFVEPLESTSIHLVKIAITRLIQQFPFGGISPAVVDRFNEQSSRELEGIRDFIILHYHATERDDSSFWNECRTMSVPDSLQRRIALFRDSAQAYQDTHDLFRVDSWVQVLLGQRIAPQSYHHVAQRMEPARLRESLDSLKGNIAAAVAKMPTHQAFIDRYMAEA
ncbi:MAG: tryptophan halogenase family protein [Sphingomicrobium sp.]